MISLVVMLLVGWFLFRLLLPRTQVIEPPPPQLVVHVHLIVPVKERPAR